MPSLKVDPAWIDFLSELPVGAAIFVILAAIGVWKGPHYLKVCLEHRRKNRKLQADIEHRQKMQAEKISRRRTKRERGKGKS
jgi:hypothetical protein